MVKRKRKGVVAVLMIVVLAIVGLTVVPAMAQGEEPTPTRQPSERHERFLATVADKLGVSVDDLQSAITDARMEMLDEAIAEGTISQERADRIKERIQEKGGFGPGFGMPPFRGGPGPGFGGPPFGRGPGGRFGGIGMLDQAVEEGIITQVQADQIKQLMEEKGGPRGRGMPPFRGSPGGRFGPTKILDEAVEEGFITQGQADQIKQLMEEKRGSRGFGMPPFRGGPGGRGGWRR